MKMNRVYYFTLKEMLDDITHYNNVPYHSKTLKDLCTALNFDTSFFSFNIETDENIKKLWAEVFAWLYEHPIIKKEVCFEDDSEEILEEADIVRWLVKFLTILSHTYPYYSTMLDEYEKAKDKLMDSVKSNTKSKTGFNDTPQNPNTEAVYEGDNYLSTFTKGESENITEFNTKMARLKELQENYKSVMADWVKEFEKVFYEEV